MNGEGAARGTRPIAEHAASAAAAAAAAAGAIALDESPAAAADPDSDEPAVIGSGVFTRVDSLTLALEAIQAAKSASCQLPRVLGAPADDVGNASSSSRNSRDSGTGSEDEPPRRAKRASSLKLVNRQLSCPDDAQHTKKAVRFADAMGLDLARVRHVFDMDSPPEIPPQATRDLVLPPSDDEAEEAGGFDWRLGLESGESEQPPQGLEASGHESAPHQPQQQQRPHLYLSPSFAQPVSAPNFNSRVTAQKVVLEKAYYHVEPLASTPAARVCGLVRVANLGFEKRVRVRATWDDWLTSVEVAADFQSGGGYGGTDQFGFSFVLPDSLRIGDRVTFCVAYCVNGETYWDNNFGDNYSFHCVAIGSCLGAASVDHRQHELLSWARCG